MPLDAVLTELKSMFRTAFAATGAPVVRLSNADIERWSVDLAVPRAGLYDLLALRLAHGFHRGEFPFAFCDWIVNDIHGVITMANEDRPDLFWNVLLAFDAGEYYHDNNRNEDPVAKYTRPLIAQIVGRHN